MLRTNLSTRPFYNERAVHLVIGIAAAFVVALTVVNIVQIVRLSRQNTALASRIEKDRTEAARLVAEATRIRKGINQEELKLVVAAAREANSLIDQRVFSWTEFFNQIESTLPPDVMLTSVQPKITADGTSVALTVLGRRAEDIDLFMEELEETRAFVDVVLSQGDRTDEGLNRVVIESWYLGPPEPEPPAAVPQPPAKSNGAETPAKPEDKKPGDTKAPAKPRAPEVSAKAAGRGGQS